MCCRATIYRRQPSTMDGRAAWRGPPHKMPASTIQLVHLLGDWKTRYLLMFPYLARRRTCRPTVTPNDRGVVDIHAPLYPGTYQAQAMYLPPPTQVPCGHGPFLQRPCRDPLTCGTAPSDFCCTTGMEGKRQEASPPHDRAGHGVDLAGSPLVILISHAEYHSLVSRSRLPHRLPAAAVQDIRDAWVRPEYFVFLASGESERNSYRTHLIQVQVQVPCSRRHPPVEAHPPTDLINRNNT